MESFGFVSALFGMSVLWCFARVGGEVRRLSLAWRKDRARTARLFRRLRKRAERSELRIAWQEEILSGLAGEVERLALASLGRDEIPWIEVGPAPSVQFPKVGHYPD